MTQTVLQLRDVCKAYGPGGLVVDHLNLSLPAGRLLALLGPSGCGKTTTLRVVAGFEESQGEVHIGGVQVAGPGVFVPPEKRGVGMVFQDYALFPHLSVLDNVMFGLGGLPRQQRRERARETLALVGLTIFESRMPHQLSGGQQQRVALARALAPHPTLLLLDEPFSNLDAALRLGTRSEVRSILRDIGATAILVTHDQEEALGFADELVVMRGGRIEQQGTPEQLYSAPGSAFVANFLGRSNLLPSTAQGGRAMTVLGELPTHTPVQGAALLSVRPEALLLGERGAEALVLAREFKGHDVTYTLRCGDTELLVQASGNCPLREGDLTRVSLAPGNVARVVGS